MAQGIVLVKESSVKVYNYFPPSSRALSSHEFFGKIQENNLLASLWLLSNAITVLGRKITLLQVSVSPQVAPSAQMPLRIWQSLEPYFCREGVVYWHLAAKASDATKHPTLHRKTSTKKNDPAPKCQYY